MKKLSAVLALLALLTQTFIPVAQAVSTNSQSSPWTVEKAEHLARKVYFSATPANIAELYQAGSAAAAANIVFSNTTGPDRTQYDAEILALTSSGFNWSDGGHMNRLYQYRYARDPYESKAKLFSLFEDIFPVNQSDRISHRDILDQHDLIYSNMLGNYRNLLKRQMHNPGGRGDFAMGQFLDLLDQTDSRNPNENYARELVQLFMMGDYKPGESKELGNDRNYEDRDVQALARILTGYVADPTTKVVSYDASKHNTSTGVLFLSGGTANFPFVNSSGALDLALMATPIAGNAGLSDNTIDYIFAMREEAISLFLADRLYRFYIYERPTRAELDTIAAQIRANNFEILPVVRYILSSDVMYSDKSMNGLLYKNPLELTIGTIKLLHRNSPSSIDSMLRDTNLLSRFNWSPYFPGSVFGRDGFDDNAKFYSSYIQNQWMSYTSRIAFDSTAGSYSLSEVIPSTSTGVVSAIQVATSSGNTFSGSLQISSASLYLTQTGATASGASQTGAIGPELLTLTGGSINLPSFQLTTSRGVVQFDDALLDPMTSQLTLSSGRIQSGSG